MHRIKPRIALSAKLLRGPSAVPIETATQTGKGRRHRLARHLVGGLRAHRGRSDVLVPERLTHNGEVHVGGHQAEAERVLAMVWANNGTAARRSSCAKRARIRILTDVTIAACSRSFRLWAAYGTTSQPGGEHRCGQRSRRPTKVNRCDYTDLHLPIQLLFCRSKTTIDRGATMYFPSFRGTPCSEKSPGLGKAVSTIRSHSGDVPSCTWNSNSFQ